jgi:hypothetical protein
MKIDFIESQQVAVFSRTWPAARRAGQYMPHKSGIDGYFISVGERQPAQQVCIAKNSFPVSRASASSARLSDYIRSYPIVSDYPLW